MKIQIVKFEDGTYGVRKEIFDSDFKSDTIRPILYEFLDNFTQNTWWFIDEFIKKHAHHKTLQHAANARWAWWAQQNKQPDYGVPINEKRGK